MSDKVMQVEMVSNEEKIYSGQASFVVIPTVSGELGIYPRHTPIMSLLRPGLVRLTIPGESNEMCISISGGLVEVQPGIVTVLSDIAVRSNEMDEKRVEEAKRVAEKRLKEANTEEERKAAETKLELAIAELKALEYIKSHKN